MSITALEGTSRAQPSAGRRLVWTIEDALTMVKRNLLHIPRNPELLLDVTVQPIIFVLLFRYVFGGAINVPGGSYVNYLMAGIFVQTIVFSSLATGIFLANDMQKGLIDRFRSLPMARSAVLAGRTLTDLLRGLLAVIIMLVVGILVGFRPAGGVDGWLAGLGLLLLFGFALAWVGVTAGVLLRSPESVQAAMFVAVFPLTFASSAFVPTATMPHWLRAFAANQPMTLVVNAIRDFTLGQPAGATAWEALAWTIGIVVIFAPLSVALYQRKGLS
ncbi:MAG TPA: ABC transporter permease [Thermomicrobiaceae bacterium]|nr:ABC transporter permease [Thermomicrobiaceae bacterium]